MPLLHRRYRLKHCLQSWEWGSWHNHHFLLPSAIPKEFLRYCFFQHMYKCSQLVQFHLLLFKLTYSHITTTFTSKSVVPSAAVSLLSSGLRTEKTQSMQLLRQTTKPKPTWIVQKLEEWVFLPHLYIWEENQYMTGEVFL